MMIKNNEINHKYILNIDTVCKNCDHRNILFDIFDEPTDVVACGKCNTILAELTDLNSERKITINNMLKIIGGIDDVIL